MLIKYYIGNDDEISDQETADMNVLSVFSTTD